MEGPNRPEPKPIALDARTTMELESAGVAEGCRQRAASKEAQSDRDRGPFRHRRQLLLLHGQSKNCPVDFGRSKKFACESNLR